MLIPDDDDFNYLFADKLLDVDVDEYVIDHSYAEVHCEHCNTEHRTHIKGPLPKNMSVPCYECWAKRNLPPETTEPVKPHRAIAKKPTSYLNIYDPDYDWDDDDLDYCFGFGI